MTPQNLNFTQDNPNDYFLPLDDTEIKRIDLQARLIDPYLPLFPPGMEVDAPRILDIACGPGRWVFTVARTYPETEVTGIDISKKMIAYAKSRHISNTHFQVMDARDLSFLPDHSFDFINARLIQGFMRLTDWPILVRECKRIVRPGGWLRLTESEAPFSNSIALEELYGLILQMMHKWGLIYSPTGRQGGILPLLGSFLRKAGWSDSDSHAVAIDISAGMPAHSSAYQDHKIGMQAITAALIREQVRPQEEIERLAQQALDDFRSEQFCGVWLFLSVWGRCS